MQRTSLGSLALPLLAAGCVAGGVAGWIAGRAGSSAAARVARAAEDPDLDPEEGRLVRLFEQVAPSVVFINNIGLRREPFSFDIQQVRQGSGSGFVWDESGHVVTNFHVVASASALGVTLHDGSTWPARRIWPQETRDGSVERRIYAAAGDKDLAVLKIDAPREKLHPVRLGASDRLRVGMTALAIGNPFGLDHSLTKGIISALGREMTAMTGRTITDVIQTDAAVNPGNSGGPLLDSRGRLIGVTSAIVSGSGTNSGIGFAVPVKTVRRVVEQILRYGKIIQPGLGIYYVRDSVARRWGLRRGVAIQTVQRGGPADRAGLHGLRFFRDGSIALGDVITGIDEHEIRDSDDLLNTLDRYQVGNTVKVTVLREDHEKTFQVPLEAVD